MATKKLGTTAVLKYGGTGGTAIQLVKSADFSITQNEVDVTDNDSTGAWQEFLMGNRTGTFSFTAHWDSALTSNQVELMIGEIAETDGPDLQTWAYYPSGTASLSRIYTFSGYVSEITHNVANESVVEVSVTVRITGAITVTAV